MSVLVGKQAPDFTATAVMADGSIKPDFKLADYQGKYIVLFFYPLDFTFVCPTELIAFSKRIKEFEDRDVQVIGCSIDSQFTHVAWRNTPVDEGGDLTALYELIGEAHLKAKRVDEAQAAFDRADKNEAEKDETNDEKSGEAEKKENGDSDDEKFAHEDGLLP